MQGACGLPWGSPAVHREILALAVGVGEGGLRQAAGSFSCTVQLLSSLARRDRPLRLLSATGSDALF